MACRPGPSPLGAVQLVPRSVMRERVAQVNGVRMLAYLRHKLRLGERKSVRTSYSGGVALSFQLPKEGQPANGWGNKSKR